MNKRIEIYSLISGLVFLISGIAKSLDIAVFSDTITQYGFDAFRFLSPLISLSEVLLGLLLVFRIWQKWIAFAGILLLVGFTFIYTYGIFFKGIEDCGCFGQISILNTSPALTFVRNALLICMLIVIWRKGENKQNANKWIAIIILLIMCIAAFMSGYSYRNVKKNKRNYTPQAITDSVLKDFITTSKDSTYLIFAFTYSCPHCLNSIENLKQYESSKAVNKVIGVALSDSILEKKFIENFNPNFLIKNYPAKTLFHLTKTFPHAYYIKNDSIVMEFYGELPANYVFIDVYSETLNLNE